MPTQTLPAAGAGPAVLTPKAAVAALGVATTVVSVVFITRTGWMSDGSTADKIAWSAFAVIAVLGAHLVPALTRRAHSRIRALALGLWAACMAYACFSHMTYFLVAQQDAGMRRAASVITGGMPPLARPLSQVLMEQSSVRAELAKLAHSSCPDCRRVQVRQIELRATLEALEAAAYESRRAQQHDDQSRDLQESRRVDPVATQISNVLGISHDLATLVPAFFFALVLDGLGMLFWLLLTESAVVTAPSSVTTAHFVMAESSTTIVTPVAGSAMLRQSTPADSDLTTSRTGQSDRIAHTVTTGVTAVRAALESGDLDKATVAAIQKFLGCAQGTALAVARAIRDGAPGSRPISHSH